MSIEDIREFNKNAVTILEKNSQYATARAVEEAFRAYACLGQFMWERDVAISQLEDLGFQLGQNTEGYISISKDEYEELLEYKNMYKDLCK